MLRLLQSTSSHISISISIFLLNIHPAFTSESPRSSVLSSWPHTSARFPPKPGHPSLRRLELPPPFQARGFLSVPAVAAAMALRAEVCLGLFHSSTVPSRPGCSSSSESVHSLKLLSTWSAFMGLPLRMCSRRGGSFSSLLSLASRTVSGKWQSISSVQFRRSVMSDSL